MFFKKKAVKIQKDEDRLSYFIYRDSLTGQMNKAYAIKTYESVRHIDGYGGVLVHIANVDSMPYYKAECYIREAAQIIVSVTENEVARCEDGYFVIFAKDYQMLADKLAMFLSSFSDGDKIYAVGDVALDENDSFDMLFRKLKRRVAAAENAGYTNPVRELPII